MSDPQPLGYIPEKNLPVYGKVTITFEAEHGMDIIVFDKATLPMIRTNYEEIEMGPYFVEPQILNVEITLKPLRQELGGIYSTEKHYKFDI